MSWLELEDFNCVGGNRQQANTDVLIGFFFFFLENTWFAFVRQPMLVPLLSALALSRVCLGTHPRERGHLKQPVKKIFVPSFFSSYVMELVSI
jgi:hypothetical protein